MTIIVPFITSIISGLYTSLWGAFKDSPYEGFKPKTFPRSIYFHVAIFLPLYFAPFFSDKFQQLGLVQIFFLIMGLERFLAEIYKGFFRTEDQQKYAATDVLYLHRIKDKLDKMLFREKRSKLAKACFDFIQYRTDLDINGWSEQDIFKH